MSGEDDFEPRPGKARALGRGKPYLSRVLSSAMLASGGRFGRSAPHKVFAGARIGRGAGVAGVLAPRDVRAGFRTRRVAVKISTPRLAGKGIGAARAHMRYIQRDGVTRDGAPGQLYAADTDRADGRAFIHRAEQGGDARQFRLIVSAEDGAQYDDLKPLTRRLMNQVEKDLGTRLDWMAVDHFNTGHPHTHIIVRGRDDQGGDLIIAKDYLTRGLRERAAELVSLDLGPATDQEIAARLSREAGQERMTSLDRSLLRSVEEDGLVSPRHVDPMQYTARAGRLATLARLGLAQEETPTRYRLSADLEETLRRMGERGDIQRTLYRALQEGGVERALSEQAVWEPGAASRTLVGRLVRRGLADESRDRHFLVVDGVDGRAHYVDIGRGVDTPVIAEGAVVEIAPRSAEARSVDYTVAQIAQANEGRYSPDLHLAFDKSATEAFAQAHVRRLEALRRAGAGVERQADGSFTIAPDHLDRAAAHEARRAVEAPVVVRALSAEPIERQTRLSGPTWLDRQLLTTEPEPLRDAGFGREVRAALAQRRQWLIEEGLAAERDGAVTYGAGLLARLERRERLLAAEGYARTSALTYVEARPGERVEGIYRQSLDLAGGRVAVIERSRDFTLVPWRSVLEGREGRVVSGLVRTSGVSWTLGRGRGGPSLS
jgi:type IV secretory pathway VirD2 relaxase